MEKKKHIHQGIKILGQKNLYETCFGTPEGKSARQELIDGICMGCRNPECVRAGHGSSKWQNRMKTQVDHLLNNPKISDLSSENHKNLSKIDIPEVNEKIVISSKLKSWDQLIKPDEEWESDLPNSLKSQTNSSENIEEPPTQKPKIKSRNTVIPSEGITIGPPVQQTIPEDPWVDADKIVKTAPPGAIITLK